MPEPQPPVPRPTDLSPVASDAQARPDHSALIAFMGGLALVLLLVGAIGVSARGGASHAHDGQAGARRGHAEAEGHGQDAGKVERRASHEAEKQERKARQEARKARRQELRQQLRQQRQQSGATGPKVTEALSEQTGTLTTQATTGGETDYVLQTATGDLVLEVGPAWFWGASHPLAPFVGQTVTVTGLQKSGSDHYAVFTIGDQVIRGLGRTPWAGGPNVNGLQTPMSGPTTVPTPIPSASPSASPSAPPSAAP